MERRFYLVDAQVLPEVFLKVVRAKELLASGEARSISAATRAVELSRSAFYKYQDCIFDSENDREVVTVMATLRDETGALQSLLAGISAALGERPGERFAGAGAGHRRGRVRGNPEEGHHRAESGTPGCAHDPGPAGGLQRPRHRRCRLKALPFGHPAPRRKAAGTAAEHPQGNGGDFKAR